MSSELVNPEWDDDNDKAIWTVAGYTDWTGDYHNLENEDFTDIGDWYSNADTVVLSWQDADDGSTQYATLVGPWDDYDDLEDQVDTYFEEGSA